MSRAAPHGLTYNEVVPQEVARLFRLTETSRRTLLGPISQAPGPGPGKSRQSWPARASLLHPQEFEQRRDGLGIVRIALTEGVEI